LKQIICRSGKFITALLLAVLMAVSPISGVVQPVFAASPIVFGNYGYAYGKAMSTSAVTLVTEVSSGNVESINWQYSSSKTGSYYSISGANSLTYTFTPTNGYWYRCVVNGYTTTPVQLLKENTPLFTIVRNSNVADQWYVSNGYMAYTSRVGNTSEFDVVGRYTNSAGSTYWINTSFPGTWTIQTNKSDSRDSKTGQLDALRFSFSESKPHKINAEADLAAGVTDFAFGCDAMLGDGRDGITTYADTASLKAIYNNDRVTMLQMVGAATVDSAKVTDPAFVISYTDTPSYYWIGPYSSRVNWSYNTSIDSQVVATRSVNSKTIVTQIGNQDSGLTSSWENVPSGGTVDFGFSIGNVDDTGAQITANANVSSDGISFSGLDTAYQYMLVDSNGNAYTGWLNANSDGTLTFSGLKPDSQYVLKARRISTGTTSDVTDVTTAIDPVSNSSSGSSSGSGSSGGSSGSTTTPANPVTTTATATSVSYTNLTTSYTYSLQNQAGQTVKSWSAPTADGKLTFSNLTPNTNYYLAAKSSTNTISDRVLVTTKPAVQVQYNLNATDTSASLNGITTSPYIMQTELPYTITAVYPTRTGYTFQNWNTSPAGNGTTYSSASAYNVFGNVVLYAQWKLNNYPMTVLPGTGYTVSASGSADYMSTYNFTISAQKGYSLENIVVSDGVNALGKTYDAATNSCSFSYANVKKGTTFTVSGVKDLSTDANSAIGTLENAANAAKTGVNGLGGLIDSEKQTYIQQIDNKLADAKSSIEDAKTTSDISTTKESAGTEIDTIHTQAKTTSETAIVNKKAETLSLIDEQMNQAKEDILNKPNLTDDEKNTLIQALEEKTEKYKQDIAKLDSLDSIDSTKQTTISSVNSTVEQAANEDAANLDAAKDNAIESLQQQLEVAKQQINDNPNLTDEEKTEYIRQLIKAENQKEDLINSSDKITGVNNAEGQLPSEINTIQNNAKTKDEKNLSEAKQAAEDKIQEEKNQLISEIQSLKNLSDEEKAALIQQAEKNAETAISKIEENTKISDVTDNETTAKNNVMVISTQSSTTDKANLDSAKETAIQKAVQSSEDAKAAIDAMDNLTEEEKSALKAKVDEALEAAKEQIKTNPVASELSKNLDTFTDITEKTTTEGTDQAAKNLENEKETARNQATQNAEQLINTIDSMTNLTDEEKNQRKEAVRQELQKVLNEIDQTTNVQTVSQKVSDVQETISSMEKEAVTQDATNLQIAQEEEKKIAEAKQAEEEKKIAETKQAEEEKRIAEAKQAEEEKRIAETKQAEEEKRIAEAKQAEEEKRIAEVKQAEEEKRIAEAKQAEEEKRIADIKKAEEIEAQKTADILNVTKSVESLKVKNEATIALGKGKIEIQIYDKTDDGTKAVKEISKKAGNTNVTDSDNAIILSSAANVIEACLTDSERMDIENGSRAVITLTVKSKKNADVNDETKLIQNVLKEKNISFSEFLDISITKTIGDKGAVKLSNLNENLKISFDIPEKMQKKNAKYYIVRSHEGECVILQDIDDDPTTVTIQTDRFSTYVMGYVQTAVKGQKTSSDKCSICGFCSHPFGICIFLWGFAGAVLTMVVLSVFYTRRNKKENIR
jgi:uncharacterized repeat protein (TIGR02543 family)